ncbi:MAG TPA: hypothetical protein VHK90_04020 [Thermoanaerobaculia bacterium]|nr:hypothetical protein [Thermoanaerobaculia bacterium]
MTRRALSLIVMLVVATVPLSASQFIEQPFDEVARGSKYIVRGHVVDTYSAWDDAREVIYTYATVRVNRYFGEITGPDTLVVREVGGTVDGYTQEAIGFPAIRRGEQVVLFLSEWENSTDLRIHAYNQGKFLVQMREGREIVTEDPVKQGDGRLERPDGRFAIAPHAEGPALSIDELATMIDDARAGLRIEMPRQHK